VLTKDPKDAKIPKDSGYVKIDDLSVFYQNNIAERTVPPEPDPKYGVVYYLSKHSSLEDGFYYMKPDATSAVPHVKDWYKLDGAYVANTRDEVYGDGKGGVNTHGIKGVKRGSIVYVHNDDQYNGVYVALNDSKEGETLKSSEYYFIKDTGEGVHLGVAPTVDFNPYSNTPTEGYQKGDYWTAGVDGDYLHFKPPTSGLIGVKKDDKLIWNGSEWAIGLTGVTGVTSVFGRTGIITAQADDYDIPKITGLQDALDGKISVIIDKGEANLGTPSPVSPVLGDTYTVTWAGDYVNFKPSIPDPLIAEVDDRLYWDGKNWIILDAATKDWVNKKFGRFTFLNTLAGQKDSVQVDSVDMFIRTTTDDQYKRTEDTKLLMRENRLFLYSGEKGKTEKAQISVASAGAVAISVTDKTGTRYNTSFVGRKVLFSSLTIAEIDSTDPGNEKSAVTKEWVEQRVIDGGTFIP
jgi:hypothetical protein